MGHRFRLGSTRDVEKKDRSQNSQANKRGHQTVPRKWGTGPKSWATASGWVSTRDVEKGDRSQNSQANKRGHQTGTGRKSLSKRKFLLQLYDVLWNAKTGTGPKLWATASGWVSTRDVEKGTGRKIHRRIKGWHQTETGRKSLGKRKFLLQFYDVLCTVSSKHRCVCPESRLRARLSTTAFPGWSRGALFSRPPLGAPWRLSTLWG